MIKIGKAAVYGEGGLAVLCSHLTVEGENIEGWNSEGEDIYFSTDKEYEQYLTYETSDCFIVAIILLAITEGHDIECNTLSEKLYYNMTNTAIPMLAEVWSCKKIKIYYQHLTNKNYEGKGVGTGCSLGVDSFSTIMDHIGEECPPSFRITHFTYFNVGAHGDKNLDRVKMSYEKDYQMVSAYARYKNIPVVRIESNISKYYAKFKSEQNLMMRNMAAVLSMQKLFHNYIYASSYHLKDTHYSTHDAHYQMPFLLPAFSTESSELISGDPCLNRSDKTRKIADFEIHTNIYMCV